MSQSSAEPTALVAATAVLVACLTGLLAFGDRHAPAIALASSSGEGPVAGPTTIPAGGAVLGLESSTEPAGTGEPATTPQSAPAAVTIPLDIARDVDPQQAGADRDAGRDPALGDALSGKRIAELCRRIGAKLGSVSAADCERVDFHFDGARSVLGAPLVATDFEPAGPKLGRVLLLGGIHGDEYSSISIVFRWLEGLIEKDSLGDLHWRIIPLLNPDGLLRPRSQRMNERGVDLNRNFPTENWVEDATDYWVRRTGRNPRRYPGPGPLSEPESRYLHAQIQAFAPDLIVAVHAPLEVVDFDGPPDPPERLGSLYLHRMGTYPGSLGRYGGEQLGLPVVTIELSSAGIMPPPAEVRRIWRDLVEYAQRTLSFDGDASIVAEPTAGASRR